MADDDRDALELLARMLVGGGYRVPVEGRSTLPALSSGDIAGAVAYMRDPLRKAVVLAVATRAGEAEIGRMAALAYQPVCEHIREQCPGLLNLSDPCDRWRLRLVIRDAATGLVWPERKQSCSQLARASKMRKAVYLDAHACAIAVLQAALSDGRREFAKRLFRA